MGGLVHCWHSYDSDQQLIEVAWLLASVCILEANPRLRIDRKNNEWEGD